MARHGVSAKPYKRHKLEQVEQISQAVVNVLIDTGPVYFNSNSTEVFGDCNDNVAAIKQRDTACWIDKIPMKLIMGAAQNVPSIELDAHVCKVEKSIADKITLAAQLLIFPK